MVRNDISGTDVKAKDPKDAISALGNVRKSFKTYVADTTIDVGHAVGSYLVREGTVL
jgi:hypothetical protein